MTTTLVVAPGFASSAAPSFSRLALAIKMVPKIFIARGKTVNDRWTRCASGIYRRAHYGRDGRILRGGNCNPVGKAGLRSPERTKGRGWGIHSQGARAVRGVKRTWLPALEAHFVWWTGARLARPG